MKNVSTWTADDAAEVGMQLSDLKLSDKGSGYNSDAPHAIHDEEDSLEEGKLNQAIGGEAAAAELEASGSIMIEVGRTENNAAKEESEAMALIAHAVDLLGARAEAGVLEEERMVLLDDNEESVTGPLRGFRL